MGRQISLAATTTAALLFLLSSSSTQAFQPASSLSSHHHHHPLASAVAGNEETVQIVTSPITGSETNIKYPTQRGSEVDSRKIINYNTKNDDENNNASPLLAL
eukprot:scaffold7552_cov179-Skeletonema_marinoi.AAC.1